MQARDPQTTLDPEEVADITALLEQAAELLTREDGCCHQLHQTGRWRDSQLVSQWLTGGRQDRPGRLTAQRRSSLLRMVVRDHPFYWISVLTSRQQPNKPLTTPATT
jgi:hypothetical protein